MQGSGPAPRHLLDVIHSREQGFLTPLRCKHAFGQVPSAWRRMALDSLLRGHRGCVNHIQFNDSGTILASGSDDTTVILWDVASRQQKQHLLTPHTDNIFCVQFLPGDAGLVTCAGDSKVCTRAFGSDVYHSYPLHEGRAKKLVVDGPNTLLSCGEDGYVHRLDMRTGRSVTPIALTTGNGPSLGVSSISAPRYKPWLLAVGADDDMLRVFDWRKPHKSSAGQRGNYQVVRTFKPGWGHPPELRSRGYNSHGISGVCFADDGNELLGYWMGSYVFSFRMDQSEDPEVDTPGCMQEEDDMPEGVLQDEMYELQCIEDARRDAAEREMQLMQRLQAQLQGEQLAMQQRLQQRTRETHGMRDMLAVEEHPRQQQPLQLEAAEQEDEEQQQQQQQRVQQADANMQAAGRRRRVAGQLTDDAVSSPRSVMEAVEQLEAGQLHDTRQQASLARSILTASQLYLDEGNVSEALRFARAALLAQPNLGRALYQVAVCLEIQGDVQAALQAAESALQLAWSYELQSFTRALRRRVATERAELQTSRPDTSNGSGGSSDSAGSGEIGQTSDDMESMSDGYSSPSSDEALDEDWGLLADDSDHGFFDWGGEPGESGPLQCTVQADEERLLGRALAQLDGPPDAPAPSSNNQASSSDGSNPYSPADHREPSSSSAGPSRHSHEASSSQGSDHMAADYLGRVHCRDPPSQQGTSRSAHWYRNRQHASWATPGSRGGAWRRYMGSCNVDTYKDVNYAGPDQQYVVAGGDMGHLLVWERSTGKLVTCLQGDRFAINCVKGHPHEPLLASCGIGTSIKVWTPCLAEPRRLSDQLLSRLAQEEMMRISGATAFSREQQLDLILGRRQVEDEVQSAQQALRALGYEPR